MKIVNVNLLCQRLLALTNKTEQNVETILNSVAILIAWDKFVATISPATTRICGLLIILKTSFILLHIDIATQP